MSKELALFCILHPGSIEKKSRVLTLLSNAKPYYQSPTAQCTTWTYFTPSNTLSLNTGFTPASEQDTLIAGMEIYTDKSALSTQTESAMFKDFTARVATENLYAQPEELVAWYLAGGFVSRDDVAPPFGRGVLVLTAKLTAYAEQRDRLVDVLSEYAEWVKQNEPGFRTYSIMTRPKAPDQVLIFERCDGKDAFQSHVGSKTFKAAMKQAQQYIKTGQGQEWTELDNAFLGNVLGGKEGVIAAKL